ncbi:MAG: TolC family outer membrane protein [Betaproteobacteria bacterium]|nr:TolC family outer membrane protein [Betaproteobacteria bacterium]
MRRRFPRGAARHDRRVSACLACFLFFSAGAAADDLLSLYLEAMTADASFLSARAENEAQQELLPLARAQFFPSLSLSGSQSRNTTTRTDQGPWGPNTTTYNYRSKQYAFSLRQMLFRPYQMASYRQAEAQVESADAAFSWARQELASKVGAAYFEALSAQSEVEVNRAQQDAYQAQMRYAEKAFSAGSGTRTDIDEARARLDLARAEGIELAHRLGSAKDVLQAMVNRPLSPLIPLDPERMPLIVPEPGRLDVWIAKAETENPRILALRADLEAARREIQKTQSGHLPTVDLIAQRAKSKNESNTSIGSDYDTGMVGVQVNMPIFSGGYVSATVRQAHALVEKARQQLEAGRREIGLMVKKEFDGVMQGIHWVRAYEQAAVSAEQTLYSTRKGVQAGVRNNLDILNAEQNLATARMNLSRGRHHYALAHLRLLALTGGLNETEIRRLNGWFGVYSHKSLP